MSKLLLVEDDETIVENLCVFLQQEGFLVESVFGQKQAIELLEEKYYDLVLLDISLADGNGFAICSYIKQNTDIPVIFLTASGDEYSVVTGLDMGADDYIYKPFVVEELVARVKAHLRREDRTHAKPASPWLEVGCIRLNQESFEVTKQGAPISLSTREFQLLQYLMENAGRVLSREQIFNAVWGEHYGDIGTVAVNIKNLRTKIDPASEYIKTIWGVGYKFIKAQE